MVTRTEVQGGITIFGESIACVSSTEHRMGVLLDIPVDQHCHQVSGPRSSQTCMNFFLLLNTKGRRKVIKVWNIMRKLDSEVGHRIIKFQDMAGTYWDSIICIDKRWKAVRWGASDSMGFSCPAWRDPKEAELAEINYSKASEVIQSVIELWRLGKPRGPCRSAPSNDCGRCFTAAGHTSAPRALLRCATSAVRSFGWVAGVRGSKGSKQQKLFCLPFSG
ncbi:uncharacterized protein LOC131528235 [Onychostoma macrolepis]|uniref:uncharacterized protein LOC131528235 n=1 Tax=Onychostoma macrolepis TaxID=369639 RepID=UPI00272CEB45|nr:uncharacterized protein LOC131528235 [Onychostoma macrolepis]